MSLLLALLAGCGGQDKQPRFRLLSPERSGVQFVNVIEENARYNIIDFEYLYNGGGLGVGDLNGDSLPDLFFAGNQVDNRLYLNRGGLRFEDITAAAGVAAPGQWCSGVAIADVNADGRLDVYVCANMELEASARANLLYLNQGNDEAGRPRFENVAAACGVADTGYSTQAAFFDYDNDNDLDLYVMSNQVEGILPNNYRPKKTDGSHLNTDRLYRNEGLNTQGLPRFVNVSKEAGILIEGYGLGLAIVDINQDGWRDIYVCNDYLSNDLLWINQGDGSFRDEAARYLKHTSHSAMGNDVADLNGDALPDIVALDMLPEDNVRRKRMIPANSYSKYINNEAYGYSYQYVRNTLQLHNGYGPGGEMLPFSEVGLMAGMAASDWSWSSLFADYDNDGDRDLLITNGFPKDVSDQDFAAYRQSTNRLRTSKAELLAQIPVVKIPNYLYRNDGSFPLRDVSAEWGLKRPSFTNGTAYADLDRDGDLDLIMNNIDEPAGIWENRSAETEASRWLKIGFAGPPGNPGGFGARVEVFAGGRCWYEDHSPFRGYLSSQEPGLHLGLGEQAGADSLRVRWPDGRCQRLGPQAAGSRVVLRWAEASSAPFPQQPAASPCFREVSAALGLDWTHEEREFVDFDIQRTLPHKFSQTGPRLAAGDLDGDGRDDLVAGGSILRAPVLFFQTGKGFRRDSLRGEPSPKEEEDCDLLLFDAEGDGDLDLYICSGGYERPPDSKAYQDRLYLNDGRGRLARSAALPEMPAATACVRAADFDGDGDLDLFVGGQVVPGSYPRSPRSYLLRNASAGGKAAFEEATEAWGPELAEAGMVRDAMWQDLNADGRVDLILLGEWMSPRIFLQEAGVLRERTGGSGLEAYSGWWRSLAAGDLDGDGDTDFVAGNLGLNSFCHARDSMPLEAWAADFDANGSFDLVLAAPGKDDQGRLGLYPMPTRDDMVKQMVGIRKILPTYEAYGRAELPALLTDEQRSKALRLQARWMQSSWLERLPDGPGGQPRFAVHALPWQAQVAPLNGLAIADADADGRPDLLLSGNDFSNELFSGRYDAFNGLIIKNLGLRAWLPLRAAQSGWIVSGDARSLLHLRVGGADTWVVSQNRGRLLAFQLNADP
jgi:hypothetical protein